MTVRLPVGATLESEIRLRSRLDTCSSDSSGYKNKVSDVVAENQVKKNVVYKTKVNNVSLNFKKRLGYCGG